jgi:hypothetical protein
MEEVKQYFDKAYGKEHIKNVVDLKDLDSIYCLMQEYAESKQSSITAVSQRSELLIAFSEWKEYNGKWQTHKDQVKDFLKDNSN